LRESAFSKRDQSLISTKEVIGWWESRRIPYNLLVGSVGVVSIFLVFISAILGELIFNEPSIIPDPPIFMIFGIILYGIMANIFYTAGWVVELTIRRLWPKESDSFATLSFRLGIIFSVLLTITPGLILLIYSFVVIIFK